jgi:hypothetical protein
LVSSSPCSPKAVHADAFACSQALMRFGETFFPSSCVLLQRPFEIAPERFRTCRFEIKILPALRNKTGS